MLVTIHIKQMNSKFSQEMADAEYDGKESDDNYRVLWEDEFDIKGDVTGFKIRNNAVYQLRGLLPDDTEFSYDIPEMTIVECTLADGSVTQIPISKKLIIDTDKQQTPEGILFTVSLKSSRHHVNPMEGVYILKDHFPKELL